VTLAIVLTWTDLKLFGILAAGVAVASFIGGFCLAAFYDWKDK
jgi:hypothetical protein